MPLPERPRLRAVETIFVPDATHGQVLVLRDTQGIADGHAVLPPALVQIVACMTGASTCAEIAAQVAKQLKTKVPEEIVTDLVRELDEAGFLEGDAFEARLVATKRAFAESTTRDASHSGGAYPKDPNELTEYIERKCMPGKARERGDGARVVGLVSPHIDPWRGAVGYGRAYAALAAALPEEAETFVLLGTSHAPMREPFALTRKSYDTPLGPLAADVDAIARLERAARFDPYEDELNHKREHSIEFQAVFLKHVLGEREARVVPILAGLGAQQSTGADPRGADDVARFVDALHALVNERPGKVVVIAGADLAHVGPRFGDQAPSKTALAAIERTDRASLSFATSRESAGFWEHVAADLDTRRVCGLAPIWTLLEAIGPTSSAEVLHYEQSVDADDGSLVSHAAVGFFAR
jgi:AmmeMemoRadiSam system protein B